MSRRIDGPVTEHVSSLIFIANNAGAIIVANNELQSTAYPTQHQTAAAPGPDPDDDGTTNRSRAAARRAARETSTCTSTNPADLVTMPELRTALSNRGLDSLLENLDALPGLSPRDSVSAHAAHAARGAAQLAITASGEVHGGTCATAAVGASTPDADASYTRVPSKGVSQAAHLPVNVLRVQSGASSSNASSSVWTSCCENKRRKLFRIPMSDFAEFVSKYTPVAASDSSDQGSSEESDDSDAETLLLGAYLNSA